MKVTKVRTFPIRMDMGRRIGDANLPEGVPVIHLTGVLIDTDEGLTGTGFGEAGVDGAVRDMTDVVEGSDPRQVRETWQRIAERLFKPGPEDPAASALGAIDMALWDLKAQHAGEPLWRLLGTSGEPVKAYASGLDMPLDDQALATWYRSAASLGFKAAKVKVGRNLEDDIRRVGIVKAALNGKRVALMVDANERWMTKEAIAWVCRLEREFELTWIEEPVAHWDFGGLKAVSSAVRCAVSTGENFKDPQLYKLLVESRACDVIQCGLSALGLTGCMRVIELCAVNDIPFSLMNSPGNLAAQLANLSPTHLALEVIELPPSPIWQSSLNVSSGRVTLNDDPGHGVRFDEVACAREWERLSGQPSLGGAYRRERLSKHWMHDS